MKQRFFRRLPVLLQEIMPQSRRIARLTDQGFAQRKMAVNKVFITVMQTLKQFGGWYPGKLPLMPTIAGLAGQYQVPDAVQIIE
jgi:hypothetical protein